MCVCVCVCVCIIMLRILFYIQFLERIDVETTSDNNGVIELH